MQEPSIRASRLAIAGGLAAAIALGAAGFMIGRTTAPRPQPAPPDATSTPSSAPTEARDRILRRADLIALAASGADSLASGEDVTALAPAVAGQRFELVLPFGCSGPSDSGPGMRWHYDAASETLRIAVEPTSWAPAQWALDPSQFEVAEGFWIGRPWSSSEACPQGGPAVPADAAAITLPGQTLAVAQFFAEGDHRDARRDGQPYETVQRVPAGSFDGSRGFLLRVRGRIAAVPGRSPVHCVQPAGAEQRPLCVIGVRIDEVAIENPVTGGPVASWPVETAG